MVTFCKQAWRATRVWVVCSFSQRSVIYQLFVRFGIDLGNYEFSRAD